MIYELDKPRGVACKNLCPTGCAVYADRPKSCQEFECMWLLAGTPMFTAMGAPSLFPRADRPDALDVVFTTTAGGVRHPETGKMYRMIIANEAKPGAALTGRGASAIERLLQNGYAICVNNDKVLYRVYYPDGIYYDVPPDSDDAKLHDPRTTSPEAQAELDRKTAAAERELRHDKSCPCECHRTGYDKDFMCPTCEPEAARLLEAEHAKYVKEKGEKS
jgi:hypothetical protein